MSVLEGLLWLTLNVYHEGRSDPEIGQVAIALVTLNRAKEKNLSIKDVTLEPYQFSWTRRDTYLPDDPKAFLLSLRSAYTALKTDDFTGGATHYHLKTVIPYWSQGYGYSYINQYGSHHFYKRQKKLSLIPQQPSLTPGS